MLKYLKSRVNEHSFWVGVNLAIAAAVVLPQPWNYISFIAGVMGSLIPDGKISKE